MAIREKTEFTYKKYGLKLIFFVFITILIFNAQLTIAILFKITNESFLFEFILENNSQLKKLIIQSFVME